MTKISAARRAKKVQVKNVIVANDDLPNDYIEIKDRGIREIKDAIARSEELGEPVALRTQISPATASWLLGMNPENRKTSENMGIKYADDMRNGRWQENGAGLAISTCLALNDGQHRCMAVEETGVTIMITVTVGLTRESRMTLDSGLKRTLSNKLDMQGYQDHGLLGAMTKMIIGLEANRDASRRSLRESSDPLICERIDNDYAIIQSAKFVRSLKITKGFLSKQQIGFFHYVLSRIDNNAADIFLQGLIMKIDTTKPARICARTKKPIYEAIMTNDPRSLANARLTDAKIKRINITHAERVEIVFRAWNAWREGRTMSQLKVLGTIPDPI